ncbi:hypothetical protein J31TS4_31050 [Paenibacillus sp. J31TS4]|uniref:hypothetical protein n=1 Tax=Paenibacillus sp. J31TS4 TaxID=2807195 RepID=UPI001B17D0E8|nr:hypothetical protein [Paenibacillus sp. J31TS4]GIP39825.1 hypothetical protein J31TS4_31050 [Paenibacillus sp. J31TS4]
MDNWITEAIVRRYDNLAADSERWKPLGAGKTGTEELAALLAEEELRLYREWLAMQGEQEDRQNQWFYYKGVQDGMRLLRYLQANR